MLFALYRMGYKHEATVQGLRRTFSTIAHEHGFSTTVIEAQRARVDSYRA